MFTCIIAVTLAASSLVGAVDVRAQAPRAKRGATHSESLLELQSDWLPSVRRRTENEAEVPAALLRSERIAKVVSDQGDISASSDDPSGSATIQDLLKEELAKQEKEAKERLNIPKVAACAGTERGSVPHGFSFPENYPSDPAWTVKAIWNGNQAGLYGPEVQNARYVAVTLAEQQPSGGYYYLVFGDSLAAINTKLDLPMSDCDFGDAKGEFIRTGARPDSEPRAKGNITTSWHGTTWRVYENPVPREVPKKKEGTLFPAIEFPSLEGKPNDPNASHQQRAFTRRNTEGLLPSKPKADQADKAEDGKKTEEAGKNDPFLIKIKGLSAATTTPKATLHSDVQEIKDTLQGLMEEIQALKASGAVSKTSGSDAPSAYDSDEDVVDIKDLYLAGRLLPKKGHFQIDADGSSSIHEDGVSLRLDPGTSPSPKGGDNDLDVNLAGYSCSKFFGSLRITKDRPEGAKGITFFTFQDSKNVGSILVGGRMKKDFPFHYRLNPDIVNMSLRVHDHGTPDKDFFEVEGYLSCKVDCSARALDTDTGSCESLTTDRVRCEGAADPHGRPCQWNGESCFSIESGRCSRETLCYEVLDGMSDCSSRTDYDSCCQRTDSSGTLCGWKDKDKKCFASTFNCKAAHGWHNQKGKVTTTQMASYKEYITEGKSEAYKMVN